jgi:hypothetical protein
MPRPPHPPRIDNSNYTWCKVQITLLLVMKISKPSRHSPLFNPNALHSTLFPNTLSLCSYFNGREQFSRPYRTTGNIIVLYILILILWTADEKTEGSGLNVSKPCQKSKSSQFSPESNFELLVSFPEGIWTQLHAMLWWQGDPT